MPGYVVEYHRRTRDWRVTAFPGADGHRDALRARLELERDRQSDDWEIASLNGDSLAVVKQTHSRYFEGRELEPQHA